MRFGTFNIRGYRNKKSELINDLNKYKIDIIGIQETKHGGHEHLEELDKNYIAYLTGKNGDFFSGVGIIVKKELKPKFETINERICTCEIKADKYNIAFICTYAHTSVNTKKDTKLNQEFYSTLEQTIKKYTSKWIIRIDFNAHIGNAHLQVENICGKYTRGGKINENGLNLINICTTQNLYITNTKFQHKLAHTTTWTAPYRAYKMKNGEKTRNPIRNQIHYTLIQQKYVKLITNSRSYGGFLTDTRRVSLI